MGSLPTEVHGLEGEWGPKVNKLEQVSSDGHQMSLVEGKWGPCPVRSMSGGGLGFLYSEIQCIMGNGHMGPLPHVDRITDRHD